MKRKASTLLEKKVVEPDSPSCWIKSLRLGGRVWWFAEDLEKQEGTFIKHLHNGKVMVVADGKRVAGQTIAQTDLFCSKSSGSTMEVEYVKKALAFAEAIKVKKRTKKERVEKDQEACRSSLAKLKAGDWVWVSSRRQEGEVIKKFIVNAAVKIAGREYILRGSDIKRAMSF